MNVSIIIQELGYEALFRQILKALIDIFSKVSTENYAIFVVNSILRKLDSTYQFFKEVNIDPATSDGELYHITITSNIDSISETEARRGIQQLLVTTMDSLGENAKEEFIKNFKESIEKKYLSKIEELGVNFHMIELHQTISTKSN
jgi:hypothetical protein